MQGQVNWAAVYACNSTFEICTLIIYTNTLKLKEQMNNETENRK